MNIRPLLMFTVLSAGPICAVAQGKDSSVPRSMNLQQAVEVALEHNHDVRISSLKVEEDEHAREVARSAYLPTIRNDSLFAHVTDTQFIATPAGAFGAVGGTTIPSRAYVINQGEKTFESSGTGLVQPLTQLFKIKSANDAARADVVASKEKARSMKDQVELKVRQLYYKILIVQSQHQAIEAKIRAFEDLQSERVQQVKFGSTLEADLIESRAQSLEAKQELLTSDLQLSDLRMQFNDAVGLPIKSDAAPQVIIDNYAFSPVPLTVKVGTTVTWINLDDDPHTVDSTQGKFKSATLNKGNKFEFRFTEAGEYPFYCRFHPKMTGKIIVQP